ncbi:superoxide dismutase [Fe], chloroplastic isoform X2 [Punica granatum]|uniref:superoxide dismutase n=1 Tax=Punica granatum TaxID=22663 RepID=A0A6P8D2Y1_PUNGR|nr:superoxide dismutase [Fe], chloroplastic isoform X2 [Punica granatum]
MAAGSTAINFSTPCALFPCQPLSLGFSRSSFHRHQAAKNQRRSTRRAASTPAITAKLELKPPPYPLNALEPHMSQETLSYHWGKHHRGYVENLNKQITGTELDGMLLEDIIFLTYNRGDILPPFNNAAQIWNHEFFWESMKPDGGGKPTGDLLELIKRDFGSIDTFMEEFRAAASTQFGSGWAWLAYKANRLDVGNAVNPSPADEDKKLVVVKSPNAVNPLVWDYYPLLVIDVWEARRADYISIFMEKLVSWEAVGSRLEMAKAQAAERESEERRRQEEEEKNAGDAEAVEMYLDSNSDEPEAD